jgi:LytS/YehU family sensor histidine kinase
LAIPLLHTTRARITFTICWLILAEIHFLVLTHYGFSHRLAVYDSLVSYVLLAAAALLVTTTLRYYIPQRNKQVYLLVLVVVLSIAWVFISRAILMVLIKDIPDYEHFFSQSLTIRWVFGLLLISCMALMSVLWYTLQDQQEIEKRKTEAEQLSKEAELYKLRQQLQPHFLFNSLNSINALITSEPQQARKMVQQLSDFLRGTLKKEEHQWVSLEEELQHLQLYLEIEKVRFGHRLAAVIVNDAAGASIPAMLLQPVVENAIKFGLYDTMGDIVIAVRARVMDTQLVITVQNPFDSATTTPNKGTGFGLSSVERRLHLLFARRDLLQTATEGNNFITTIKVPQQQ